MAQMNKWRVYLDEEQTELPCRFVWLTLPQMAVDLKDISRQFLFQDKDQF